MAHRWFDWINELGGTDGHSLYLIPTAGLVSKPEWAEIYPKAIKAFKNPVTVIVDSEEQKSDWQSTEPKRSASGPNSSFRQVAWHFYMNKLGPWFWCEIDCIPTKREFLSVLEHEYQRGVSRGKPFMGAHVLLESVPEHMSGNAVYPFNVPELAPTLVMRTEWEPDKGSGVRYELAFDIAGAVEVVPKAHWTTLIQHKFRHAGFRTRQEFDDVIDRNAVVFHSNKDGSIFQFLREKSVDNHVKEIGDTLLEKRDELYREQYVEAWTDSAKPENGSGTSVSLTPPVRSKTLGGSTELQRAVAQMEDEPSPLPSLSAPWENKQDSEQEVRMLCEALALFCKAPVYKSRVRQALRDAKIIK